MLGQAGDERIQRAVCVRCLACRPQGEPAVDTVEIGYAAARFHGRRMHARVHHFLLDDDIGAIEDRLCRGGVAGLPIKAVVVLLAFQIVANDRRVRRQSRADVGHGLQRLVVHVDQFEGVACGVPVFGHDEGDLLPLESDLIGGQHRLDVVREGRHPGKSLVRQRRARHHRLDLGMGLGGAGIDIHDAGVRHRRPQNCQMQHAAQLHVVAVLSQSANEPGVFFAQHPAVAERVLVVIDQIRGRVFRDRHDTSSTCLASAASGRPSVLSAPSPAGWSAAHSIERTIVV